MTEPQTSSESSSTAEEQIAATITLLLAGGLPLPEGTTLAAAVAALLLMLPDAPEAPVAEPVAEAVAGLVVRDQPPIPDAPVATQKAYRQNVAFRAHYAVNAVRRVAVDVVGGRSLAESIAAERSNWQAHLDASETRLTGARLNDAAAERWGPELGWYDTGRATTHTHEHQMASGNNYRVDIPPKETDGYLPAQRYKCDCVPGPPHENGRLLL